MLAAAAGVGFAFFLMEMVWYRMLGPLLGGSVFTFGLILAVALAGIGIGGLIYSLPAQTREMQQAASAIGRMIDRMRLAARIAFAGDRATLRQFNKGMHHRRKTQAPPAAGLAAVKPPTAAAA